MWTCPKCDSKVDPSFEVCWNCGTAADGTEDPSFVRADDTGPIGPDDLVPSLQTGPDELQANELPPALRGDLVEAYLALDLMEAKFLADQLNEAGIQAASDTHDLHQSLGGMQSEPRVWVRADDLGRARIWLEAYERNKTVPATE